MVRCVAAVTERHEIRRLVLATERTGNQVVHIGLAASTRIAAANAPVRVSLQHDLPDALPMRGALVGSRRL